MRPRVSTAIDVLIDAVAQDAPYSPKVCADKVCMIRNASWEHGLLLFYGWCACIGWSWGEVEQELQRSA